MVCTSSVDASIAAEILAIGRRRVRRKMAGAMLLAAAVLGVGKVVCSVTQSKIEQVENAREIKVWKRNYTPMKGKSFQLGVSSALLIYNCAL